MKTILKFSNNNPLNRKPNSRSQSSTSFVYQIYNGLLNRFFYSNTNFLEEAEERLLSGVESPFFRFFTDIGGNINVFTISSVPYDILTKWTCGELDLATIEQYKLNKPAILFVHGFTAGSCFWVNNLDSLYHLGHAIFCIDLPGFAHSSRCDFPEDSMETENLFVEFIRLWQETLAISKVILIGHSMGGYLTYSYAIKHPEKLTQIILVDAWGFPDIKRKVTEAISSESSKGINNYITRGGVVRFISFLAAPFSPYSLLRVLGRRLGPFFVGKYRPDLAQRYSNIYAEKSYFFNEYVYAINSLYPSGEYAFRSMAQVFGWAKNPMILRFKNISHNIPITFIYGSRSWVSSECGLQIKQELKNKVRVYIVPDSGHHVYSDHPRIFNHILKSLILNIDDSNVDRLENEVSSAVDAQSCFPIIEDFEKLLELSDSNKQDNT